MIQFGEPYHSVAYHTDTTPRDEYDGYSVKHSFWHPSLFHYYATFPSPNFINLFRLPQCVGKTYPAGKWTDQLLAIDVSRRNACGPSAFAIPAPGAGGDLVG
jgi:hypothetical protein